MAPVYRLGLALALIAAALLPLMNPRPASACSCVPNIPLQTHFDEADAVLAGRVTDIDGQPYNGASLSIRVQAARVWKGPAEREVTVTTPDSGGAACAYPFAVGTEYVIYAYEWEGRLDVTYCGATHPGAPTQDELALFGTELSLEEAEATQEESSTADDLSNSSSILVLILYAGVPLVVVAVIASAIVWWRTARR